MRFIAHITGGRLCVRPLSSPLKDPTVSVSFDEHEKLTSFFTEVMKTDIWDGRIVCSSSMDFASEDGWPEREARAYLDRSVTEAFHRVKKGRSN